MIVWFVGCLLVCLFVRLFGLFDRLVVVVFYIVLIHICCCLPAWQLVCLTMSRVHKCAHLFSVHFFRYNSHLYFMYEYTKIKHINFFILILLLPLLLFSSIKMFFRRMNSKSSACLIFENRISYILAQKYWSKQMNTTRQTTNILGQVKKQEV